MKSKYKKNPIKNYEKQNGSVVTSMYWQRTHISYQEVLTATSNSSLRGSSIFGLFGHTPLHTHTPIKTKINLKGAGEMTPRLNALAALSKDLDLIPSAHMAIHNCLYIKFHRSFWPSRVHYTCAVMYKEHSYIQAKHPHKQKWF